MTQKIDEEHQKLVKEFDLKVKDIALKLMEEQGYEFNTYFKFYDEKGYSIRSLFQVHANHYVRKIKE
jgi:hypothetical protein